MTKSGNLDKPQHAPQGINPFHTPPLAQQLNRGEGFDSRLCDDNEVQSEDLNTSITDEAYLQGSRALIT